MTEFEFHHVGVPTQTEQEGESYMEGAKLYITDPTAHPYRVEFLRFEEGSPMPELLKTHNHAAFVVPSIADAMAGKEVVLPPFDATEELRVAFIRDGDALIELMEKKS
ncbi:MAG: hypothetical protein ISR76_07175 [Planctomycetes bacterium]|nr:hypothetical protein [Planctomycetota bacterium]MBL7008763.1 hypothetical protein [Planctomycetota bacterium]